LAESEGGGADEHGEANFWSGVLAHFGERIQVQIVRIAYNGIFAILTFLSSKKVRKLRALFHGGK